MNLFIDANVFALAFIDQGDLGQKYRDLLYSIAKNKYSAVTSVLVIDEFMWALVKNQQFEFIENHVRNIYELPNLVVKEVRPQSAFLAINFMKKYRLKPRDAMHCAFMEIEGIGTIVSDDPDFDKVTEVRRLPL